AAPTDIRRTTAVSPGKTVVGQAPFLRLRGALEFWKSIGAAPFVLSVIAQGYAIPFPEGGIPHPKDIPLSGNRKSSLSHSDFVSKTVRKSSLSHSDFVSKTVDDWLTSGAVLLPKPPDIASPLSVSLNGNSQEECARAVHQVQEDLEKSGALVAEEKTNWTPSS
ncbi:hypothetical protein PFISCL1PPCAC_24270, partial [Pristionchus fissidentatus]